MPDDHRATHSNDTRSSRRIQAEAKFASAREVVDETTPADIVEERDWRANGHKEPVTLRDALTTEHGARLSPMLEAWRVRNWHSLCRYVFQDGIANPWQAFKNFLAVVRRTNPEYVDSVSATVMGMLLDETKAAPSAREIRIYEAQMRKWGVLGFHGVGGTKPESARLKFKQSAKGNDNRKRGTELKRMKRRAA